MTLLTFTVYFVLFEPLEPIPAISSDIFIFCMYFVNIEWYTAATNYVLLTWLHLFKSFLWDKLAEYRAEHKSFVCLYFQSDCLFLIYLTGFRAEYSKFFIEML